MRARQAGTQPAGMSCRSPLTSRAVPGGCPARFAPPAAYLAASPQTHGQARRSMFRCSLRACCMRVCSSLGLPAHPSAQHWQRARPRPPSSAPRLTALAHWLIARGCLPKSSFSSTLCTPVTTRLFTVAERPTPRHATTHTAQRCTVSTHCPPALWPCRSAFSPQVVVARSTCKPACKPD